MSRTGRRYRIWQNLPTTATRRPAKRMLRLLPENIADIVFVSADIPEIRILWRLARERRICFGIRGGVIRNLLVTFHEWEKEVTSLFRFVDAFSDIDIVVIDEWDWPPLWQAIAASVPFAGFFRWEATSFAHVLGVEKHFEHILAPHWGMAEVP